MLPDMDHFDLAGMKEIIEGNEISQMEIYNMIQRRNQLQSNLNYNNNGVVSHNFMLNANNNNANYFTNPNLINTINFDRMRQQQSSSNNENNGLNNNPNLMNNNALRIINLNTNSVVNPGPYSNFLQQPQNRNSSQGNNLNINNNNQLNNNNGTSSNTQQQPRRDDKQNNSNNKVNNTNNKKK